MGWTTRSPLVDSARPRQRGSSRSPAGRRRSTFRVNTFAGESGMRRTVYWRTWPQNRTPCRRSAPAHRAHGRKRRKPRRSRDEPLHRRASVEVQGDEGLQLGAMPAATTGRGDTVVDLCFFFCRRDGARPPSLAGADPEPRPHQSHTDAELRRLRADHGGGFGRAGAPHVAVRRRGGRVSPPPLGVGASCLRGAAWGGASRLAPLGVGGLPPLGRGVGRGGVVGGGGCPLCDAPTTTHRHEYRPPTTTTNNNHPHPHRSPPAQTQVETTKEQRDPIPQSNN